MESRWRAVRPLHLLQREDRRQHCQEAAVRERRGAQVEVDAAGREALHQLGAEIEQEAQDGQGAEESRWKAAESRWEAAESRWEAAREPVESRERAGREPSESRQRDVLARCSGGSLAAASPEL